MRRSTLLAAGTIIAGIACLVALGVWQVQRLYWKDGLIAQISARAGAAPEPLEQVLKTVPPTDLSWRTVSATGHYDNSRELHLLTSAGGGPAFSILTPFHTNSGLIVLVDRGTVPEPLRDAARRPESLVSGEVTLTGQLALHSAPSGYFDPPNDPVANLWYTYDVPALYGAVGVPVVPVILHLVPDGAAHLPAPRALNFALSNNHLGYAITWFGLGLALAVLGLVLMRRSLARHRRVVPNTPSPETVRS